MRSWLVYEMNTPLHTQRLLAYPTRSSAREIAKSCFTRGSVVKVCLSNYKCKRQGYLIYNTNYRLTLQPRTPGIYPTKKLALQMADHFDNIYVGKHKVVPVKVFYNHG
jgi:hypothetical protein